MRFGVDLGGMTRDEARAALVDETERQRQANFTLTDSKGDMGTHDRRSRDSSMDVDKAVDEASVRVAPAGAQSRLSVLWHLRSDKPWSALTPVGVQGDQLDSKLDNLAQAIHQVRSIRS